VTDPASPDRPAIASDPDVRPTDATQRPRRGGAALLASSNIVARICAFALVVVIARFLATDDFAIVLLAQAVTQYLLIVLDFGLTLTGIRTIAANPSRVREVMGTALAIRVSISIVGVLLIAAGGIAVGLDRPALVALVLFSLAAAVTSFDVSWIAQALQATRLRSFVVAGGAALGLAITTILLLASQTAATVAIGQLLGIGLAVGIGLVIITRDHGRPALPDVRLLRMIVTTSIPLGLASLLAQVYYNLDLLLLAAWRPLTEVAIYGAVYKIVLGMLMLVWTYAGVALPRLTAAHARGLDDLAVEMRHDILTILTWMLPIAVVAAILARPIVTVLFGPAFAAGALPLMILLATIPIAAVRTIILYSFTAAGRPWAVPLSSGPGAVINLLLNIILIPRFGMVGAAATTLVAEIAVATVAAWQARGLLARIDWLGRRPRIASD
jgi:O-antigen/teichoic acid export membrane protein